MIVRRVISGKRLHAFGDRIGDVPVLHTHLAKYQAEVCDSLGIQLRDINAEEVAQSQSHRILEFDESLLFSKGFLKAILRWIEKEKPKNHIQFGIKNKESLQRFSLPINNQETPRVFPIFYKNPGAKHTEIVELCGREFEMKLRVPPQIVPCGYYSTNMNEVFAAEIISPFHLLQANMGLNFNRTIALQKYLPRFLATPLAEPFGKLATLGLKWTNRKGKNCKIHPSAVVEGCILGDNVVIGANAVVRLSVIGSDTHIGDAAVVNYSIVGKDNYVMTGNHLQFSLTYESVFTIHGPYQFSIFGRHSAVFATINCDIRLDEKTISIPTANGIVDSKQHLLGIAYGHSSKVGASNIIAAGRIVPNDTVLNPPDFIHLKFDTPNAE